LNDLILQSIDEQIAQLRQVRAILAGSATASGTKTTASVGTPKPRRKLSAKARHAIAEAQRKRWAKVKSQKKAAASAATTKKETAAS
jgi:hypothetical protein